MRHSTAFCLWGIFGDDRKPAGSRRDSEVRRYGQRTNLVGTTCLQTKLDDLFQLGGILCGRSLSLRE